MASEETVWRERGLRDAVLGGDEVAWQTLYDESFAELDAYVRWRCAGLRDLAEEIVQDCWVTAVRCIRKFDPQKGTFLNWLRGIAANVLRNRLRRRKETQRRDHCEPFDARERERHEQAESVAYALAELPENYEAVLRAKYLEQREVEEIATLWDTTSKAVESLLTRARAAFRIVYPVEDAAEKSP